MTTRERHKLGCTACRKRHLKCDAAKPACSRCVVSGAECIQEINVRFRYSTDLPIKPDQKWVKSSRNLRFVDESQDVEALYTSGEEQQEQQQQQQLRRLSPPLSTISNPEPQHQPHPQVSNTEATISPALVASPFTHWTTTTTPPPPPPQIATAAVTEERPFSDIPADSLVGRSEGNPSTERVAFPLQREHEIRLMRHYIDHMCHWFDLCDTKRNHFGCEVPKRAIICPTLLSAIFALSSRHLSIIGQYDQYASDRYHQECLQHLSTISGDSSALMNDDLLAATILLRTLEELDVPLVGTDYQGHLLGIQVFMNIQTSSVASSLRQACFWVGLRQEIYMAFVNQRPVKTKLDHSFIDRSFCPADDDTWSNRIIVYCAEIAKFSFGSDEQTPAKYQELKDYDSQWLDSRPLSFLPLSYREPDNSLGEVFPEICYLNHAVVIGIMHSIFARVLLMCYNPTLPRIGPSQKLAHQQREDEIKRQVKEMCGTALSNRRTIPGMFTACMGVTMCGDRFADRYEQMALLNVLVRTEKDHAWPTATAQEHLKRSWGWDTELANM